MHNYKNYFNYSSIMLCPKIFVHCSGDKLYTKLSISEKLFCWHISLMKKTQKNELYHNVVLLYMGKSFLKFCHNWVNGTWHNGDSSINYDLISPVLSCPDFCDLSSGAFFLTEIDLVRKCFVICLDLTRFWRWVLYSPLPGHCEHDLLQNVLVIPLKLARSWHLCY